MKETPINRVMTAPNIITAVRILLAFLWLLLAMPFSEVQARTWETANPGLIVVFVFFVVLAASDFLDGFVARKTNNVSVLGVYLDPIADKILVMCALLMLLSWGFINAFVVAIILGREFIVSAARIMAAKDGVLVPASVLGKVKTATTFISIVLYLLSTCGFSVECSAISWLFAGLFMVIAVIFTLISGVVYCAQIVRASRG